VAKLLYQDTEVPLHDDDTVLEALLRHGVDVASSCKNGVCQTCMIHCGSGNPGATAQRGVKETLAAQGYFLACQCKPGECGDVDLRVSLEGEGGLFIEAKLVAKDRLAPDIVRLVFESQEEMCYEPGQFLNLRRSDGLIRSYSIASDKSSCKRFELHVGRIKEGRMSSFLIDELAIGESVEVRGPSGSCFYIPGRPEQPLLLVGTGTGFAPLLGIVRAALAAKHEGPIYLFHGSTNASGVYFSSEMRALAAENKQLYYSPCVDQDAPEDLLLGRAADLALAAHKSLKGYRVFLCGHPEMVKKTKKLAYLGGASLSDIFSDPFEFSGPSSEPAR